MTAEHFLTVDVERIDNSKARVHIKYKDNPDVAYVICSSDFFRLVYTLCVGDEREVLVK